MDLKRLISQVSYKIESNPNGGFIARSTDPNVPAIEASTRDELLKKLQQNTVDFLAAELPGLKLPFDGKAPRAAFHVERTLSGGFSIHSADPNAPVVHTSDEHDLQSRLLETFLNFAGNRLTPDLSKALAAQAGTASIKIVVNGKTAFQTNSGSQAAITNPALQNAATDIPKLDATGALDGRPIIPEPSNVGRILKFVVWALILGCWAYLYFLHRR